MEPAYPFHAPLPRSRTPAGRAATGLSRRLPHGPRWVNGEDSRIESFVAQSHGFDAHCQRFVPASRPTTHDSFTVAWLHALPCGILTRWAPSQSFFLVTVFFHMCFSFLSVCVLLGAMTPIPKANFGIRRYCSSNCLTHLSDPSTHKFLVKCHTESNQHLGCRMRFVDIHSIRHNNIFGYLYISSNCNI